MSTTDTITTDFLVIRAKAVCGEFQDGLAAGSESAIALRDLGITTRIVEPKTGTRRHHEIVAPTEEAAVALESYVRYWGAHFAGQASEGIGGDWEETREILAKRDAFWRAHKRLAHLDPRRAA